MPSTDQNATIYQTEDVTLDFTLSGFTATDAQEITYVVKRRGSDFNTGSTVISKTLTGGGVTTPDGTSVLVSLSDTDTDIGWGEYHHQLWIQDDSSNDVIVADGLLTVKPGLK